MARAGWLAVGAIAVALLASEGGAALATAGAAGSAAVARGIACRSSRDVAAGCGALLVAGRLLVGLLGVDQTTPLTPPDGSGPWQAEVSALHGAAAGRQRATLVVRVAPPGVIPATEPETDPHTSWRVYAWLPRYPAIVPGDSISFVARLERPVPGTGFADFLQRGGYAATARVDAFERRAAAGAHAALEDARRKAGELLAAVLPAPQAGLAAGILIGLRDLVDRQLALDFATAGLSHVVAISGWNIALVGATMAALLARLARRPRTVLIVAAIAAYTVLAGASPSVVRAALMGGVVLVARESGRRGGATTALGLAATAMVVVDPATASDIGFQLSVAATAGLLAWSRGIMGRLAGALPERSPSWLVESLAVSLAAQAATLPLVLLHFGRLSLVAPLANLLVAPLVAPAMLVSLLALAAGGAVAVGGPAFLLAPVGLVGWAVLGAMVWIAAACAALPYASLELVAPFDRAAAATSAVTVLVLGTPLGRRLARTVGSRVRDAVGYRRARRQRPSAIARAAPRDRTAQPAVGPFTAAAGAMLVGAALLVGLVAAGRPDGRLRMTALDVGQGDAILLEGPRGGRMLVDGGPDPDRLLGLLDARLPVWDRRLDVVVLTHPHEDHVAGLALLLERYRVGFVAEPGMAGAGPGDAAFRRALARLRRPVLRLAAGQRLALDGARIDVRWPTPGGVPERPVDDGTAVNNVSIVLDVRYGERRFLLNGDAEEEVDPELLAAGLAAPGAPRVDVLKVAHHGSRTATTAAFVAATQPRVAIVSAGTDNPYGHPSPDTVARLLAAGSRVLRTDLDGSVSASTDGHDLRIEVTGGRPVPTRRASTGAAGRTSAEPAHAPGSTVATPSTRAAGSTRAATNAPGSSAPAVLCGIPRADGAFGVATGTSHARRVRPPSAAGPGADGERRRSTDGVFARASFAEGEGRTPPRRLPRESVPGCYDRGDAHPVARGGRPDRPRTRSAGLVPGARPRRGRDRLVPRPRGRGAARGGRSPPGGGGRAAARRRQAAARRPPAQAVRPR